MKNKKINPGQVWKQFEDVLAPRLQMTVIDRAVYLHLLRHSRLEGKLRLHFSILWLAHNIGLSGSTVRDAVRRLIEQGVLRLLERDKSGHLVEVRVPEEIRVVRDEGIRTGGPAVLRRLGQAGLPFGQRLNDVDFLQTRGLREAIHARERGVCFYCLRRIRSRVHCLDHVVPRVHSGRNSYRNLVSACLQCNSRKGERPARDYLRWLYREGRLTERELSGRLRALRALAAGRLRPPGTVWNQRTNGSKAA